MKIMLATDNHIGYLERDPIRGQDSFDAFREILQLAKEHEVSENFTRKGYRPSTTTLSRALKPS